MRILVVDDDAELRECLRMSLERASYAVDCAEDGKTGSYLARTNEYDLVILDNVLPEKSGLQVCQEMRESNKTTPIMLISVKTEADEKVKHLDSGADDYLSKPYSQIELMARVRALTRRPGGIQPTLLSMGDLSLDPNTKVVLKAGREIYLTLKEFSLLEFFLRNKGAAVSRASILEHVWDMDCDPFSRTVETHILNLRRKLGTKKDKVIYSVPGRGYKISL